MRSIINSEEEANVMYAEVWKNGKVRRRNACIRRGMKRMGGQRAHEADSGPGLGVVTSSAVGYENVVTRYRAHLTIRFGRYVDGVYIGYHGHERGETRKGIYLFDEKVSQRLTSIGRQR